MRAKASGSTRPEPCVPSVRRGEISLSKSRLPRADDQYGAATDAAPSLGPSLAFGAFLRVGDLNVARWINLCRLRWHRCAV